MPYRNKLILLLIVVFLLAMLQLAFPGHPQMVAFYANNIFRPFQSFRAWVFGVLPFSVGDFFYVYLFFALLYSVVCWVYYLFRLPNSKHKLAHSLMKFLIYAGLMYVWFFIGWGGNYYKPMLTQYWQLGEYSSGNDSTLIRFDAYLVAQLNKYAPHYHQEPFRTVVGKTKVYYKQFTTNKTGVYGLGLKPCLFGNKMEYVGIQGYYNPFTGEAQVNRKLPSFMIPFVVSHEMAHQCGIAAEEDANLLAYSLCTATTDTAFLYSAYFNIWLYTHSWLRRIDTAYASSYKTAMNEISLAHIDTLRAYRNSFKSDMSDYSAAIYDGYLRLHDQKDGIHSYSNVAWSAWEWERKKQLEGTNLKKINIP